MLANLTGWHALVILAIVLLVFGSTKLPALAKSVGQSMRILRDEVQTTDTDNTANANLATPAAAPVVDHRATPGDGQAPARLAS